MYIIDLKGLESANLQVNGCTLVLKNGQEVSEVIAKAIPKYVVEITDSVKEIKEEILTEVSGPVEVEVSEDSEEVEEVKVVETKKSKK